MLVYVHDTTDEAVGNYIGRVEISFKYIWIIISCSLDKNRAECVGAILERYVPIQNRHISSVLPFNNPIVSLTAHKKCSEVIGNDFHTYPDCSVALFHYIAL